jgi:hypothetical protein
MLPSSILSSTTIGSYPFILATLTLSEKLTRLSIITNTRLSIITNTRQATYQYKTRFAEHLHNAQWADQERRRIMESYYIGEERTWLFPLCELNDCLACAALQLEKAMRGEHSDYRKTNS